MADTMKFDLVSPEARVVSGQAVSVQIPGAEGDLTAMPNHAPVITTLRPGFLRAEMDGGVQEFAVFGGFAEITAEAASVLAEHAVAKADLTREAVEGHLEKARAAMDAAEGPAQDLAAKLVADLTALSEAATA
ncbi:MAG: F0F1 ATP synthase subunit epsilon [Paracoccaceae bacterium]|nr:F0F1 ATP synthase subunit epsilon [Paracoccaceae bacterium]